MMKRFALLVAAAVAVFASPAAAADAPLATPADFEVMLVVDTSGSMTGTPIDVARTAAVSFVTQMPAAVRIGVESFGREIKVWSPPTLDHLAVAQQLGALTTGGDTPLHDAVITATRSFTPAAQYKAIVLLSDGGDKNSIASLDDAVAALSGIHVEAVSLTTPKTDLGALTRLGTVTPAEDPAALPAVLGRLAALLIPATVEAAPASTTVAPTTVPPTTVAPTTVPSTIAPTTVAPTMVPTTAAPTTVPAPTGVVHSAAPAPPKSSQAGTWIRLVVVALFLAGIVALVAGAIVAMRRRDRRAAFAASMPQALQLLTSSLRSGHDMMQALDTVAVGADEPARGEFQRVIIRTRLGRDLSDAIGELAQRMQNTELERVAAAIDIHQETGGKLADILDSGSHDPSLLADVYLSREDACGAMGDR